ncbi:MAG: FHA domain-containing protein [Acidobacteriaceae bacterium]|nr:FHA domain-containing protein [Acidobacteriaceae bacterium]
MSVPHSQIVPGSTPALRVSVEAPPGVRKDFEFTQSFHIGRIEECEICIKNEFVSRHHVEIACETGQWRFRDLQSSNGVFINGQQVPGGTIQDGQVIRLGVAGPEVKFGLPRPVPKPVETPSPKTVAPQQKPDPASVDHYLEHYFGNDGRPAGDHTIMVRQAFSKVQKKQRLKYLPVIVGLAVIALAAGGYALWLHREAAKQKALAQDIFYGMKSLDVDIARVETLVSGTPQGREEIRKYQSRRQEMEKNYERFLTTLHVYDTKLTPQQRLILRVARIFGECELAMPPDFEKEVNNYIQKWKSSKKLENGIRTANANGYTSFIAKEFLSQDLPPQFFYLAMQESAFDPLISGPPTHMGFAKGMWQFVPKTAAKYGLKVGPLALLPRPDPADDRHHWDRETKAAAAYIKDLYSTDAQASGLLVMACYNWGEDYVLPYVKKMPANPRDRNFWRLLALYKNKIPEETYNYVFYIVSAAVIGEDPHLFGFNFDNPLAHVDGR